MTSMRCSGNRPVEDKKVLKRLKITTFGQLVSVRLLTVAESQTSHNGRCYHKEDKDSTMLPSGSALLKLRAVMMLFTSLSILLATPGYWRSRRDVRLLYFITVYSCVLTLVSPESSWRPLCRPSVGLNAPDRWTPLQTASPQSTPAGLSSSGRGRCWWLSAERGQEVSRLWAHFTEFVLFSAALSIKKTLPSSA